ncbi:MAG: DUF4270 domain-containing protein [Bacteroidales bacterium]|nr:DUF4270 domain-containing protein [Bacteroidales bacterium]
MNLNFKRLALFLSCSAAALAGSHSCISTNMGVGENMIPIDQQYSVYRSELDLKDVYMQMADSLSGFSNSHITIGAIRDPEFGLTKRGCALTLVPMLDTMDFGKNTKIKAFNFNAAPDSVSYADENQKYIIQNINVYELEEAPDFKKFDINGSIKHGKKRITKGSPVYTFNGDSLTFKFSDEFAQKFLTIKPGETKNFKEYLKRFPGIYIETDVPAGEGGRINTFNVQLGFDSQYYYFTDTYASLDIVAEYDGVQKDTSFLFYYSPTRHMDVDSLLQKGTSGNYPQYCLNIAEHSTRDRAGKAKDKILVEGGGGLKPVVKATDLKKMVIAELSKHGDPSKAIVNRATLVFPFEFPEDYKQMYKFPSYLNPTVKVKGEDYVSFASLTDTSSEDEDPGAINRSLLQYSADISYHVQSILSLKDESKISNYDVWFLNMSTMTVVTSNESNSSMSDYYNYLAYSSYYNSMYGGYGGYGGYGYGGYGYGGYGGYGDYYSNYYNYAMMASLYSSSSSTTSEKVEMNSDSFFCAELNGPDSPTGRTPKLNIVFSFPKE